VSEQCAWARNGWVFWAGYYSWASKDDRHWGFFFGIKKQQATTYEGNAEYQGPCESRRGNSRARAVSVQSSDGMGRIGRPPCYRCAQASPSGPASVGHHGRTQTKTPSVDREVAVPHDFSESHATLAIYGSMTSSPTPTPWVRGINSSYATALTSHNVCIQLLYGDCC
jgi:hypothetical protein